MPTATRARVAATVRLLALASTANARSYRRLVAPGASPPAFGPRGAFTILQVSDTHVCGAGDDEEPGAVCSGVGADSACSDANTTAFVRRAIAAARPDLVVFTGDNICARAADPFAAMLLAFGPAIDARVPWAAVLGNHDDEGHNLSRAELVAHAAALPGFVATEAMALSPTSAGTLGLHVRANSSAGMVLWLLDSGSAHTARAGAPPVSHVQLGWIGTTAARLAVRAGLPPTSALPSLAFLHKPLAQFAALAPPLSGARNEAVSAAFSSAHVLPYLLERAGVRAVFAGHDHLNDFCVRHGGAALCCAGAAGYRAYGRGDIERRVRVIRALENGRLLLSYKLLDSPGHLRVADCERLYGPERVPATVTAAACRPAGFRERPAAGVLPRLPGPLQLRSSGRSARWRRLHHAERQLESRRLRTRWRRLRHHAERHLESRRRAEPEPSRLRG